MKIKGVIWKELILASWHPKCYKRNNIGKVLGLGFFFIFLNNFAFQFDRKGCSWEKFSAISKCHNHRKKMLQDILHISITYNYTKNNNFTVC